MSLEYELVSCNELRVFGPETLQAMRDYWNSYPIYIWEDNLYFVFNSLVEREQRIAWVKSHPKENDYLTSSITFGAREIEISSVGDAVVDCWFADFVRWCQERWPCELQSWGQPIRPEAMLAKEE